MTTTFSFRGRITDLKPVAERVNVAITSFQAEDAVRNLQDNWFGQMILSAANVMHGKTLASDEAAKMVAKDVETFRAAIFDELMRREEEFKSSLTGDKLNNQLASLNKTRASAINNIRSAKSVLVGALNLTDTILPTIKDGGHVLWRTDGTPRGKSELQGLIKEAKSEAEPAKSAYEQALTKAHALAKLYPSLSPEERDDVTRRFMAAVAEYVADTEGEDDDSTDVVAEAA